MLLRWLKAKDAAEAGCTLADSFPTPTAGAGLREFIHRATQELRALELNFYRRVRFANAFKWRLLEKGVTAETAHDITQTLLVNAFVPVADTTSGAAQPAARNRQSLDVLFQQAGESLARGAYEAAVTQYQEYIAARPAETAAYNNLGAALTRLGRLDAARQQLREAILRNPRSADALCNLGTLFLTRGRFADAENYFRRAASLKPTDSLIRANLGEALVNQGLLDKARGEFAKVMRTAPRCAPALCGMGSVERAAGRFAEAERMFRRALEVDPTLVPAWVGLAGSRRMTAADAQWLAGAEKALANTTAPPEQAGIRFAIGKYFDDLGQYPQAFKSYQRANELLKPLAVAYTQRVHAQFVDDLAHVYTPRAIAGAKAGGSPSTRPVFIVGMPRSGTSLMEQILASHPVVAGIGESNFWTDVVGGDEMQFRKGLLAESTRRKLAADYLALLKSRHPDAGYVVDKTPRNADCLGLIHSVFPHARILYMRRDPIDTCLSCYFQNLSGAMNYTFDLNDLAGYYREHARLVAHWREVLPPGTMLDVPYEELVADQESWTRRVLAFLGLEWDAACLKFDENSRPVVTASSWQVRQRIYGDSVKRWRNYSKFVGPLRNLDPA